tara:strand:+ start:7144 stop:7731 length:588 start_codon:yes stop_codon:yes gene_type:complete
MNLKLLDSGELDIDLAFSGFTNKSLCKIDNLSENFVLNNLAFWHRELFYWLSYLRKECVLSCPRAVRENNSFSIGLQFTDDHYIRDLNSKWRHQQKKTDVLSFPVLDESLLLQGSDCIELGDIVVSIPTAQSQAEEEDHSLEKELRWLVSHGLLHLLGWVHPNGKQLNEMLSLQEQLLTISGNLQPIWCKNKEHL